MDVSFESFENETYQDSGDNDLDQRELRAIMMEYHTLKWGATLSLLLYFVAFLLIVFQKERKCYLFIIVPILLCLTSYGLMSFLIWYYIDHENMQMAP